MNGWAGFLLACSGIVAACAVWFWHATRPVRWPDMSEDHDPAQRGAARRVDITID